MKNRVEKYCSLVKFSHGEQHIVVLLSPNNQLKSPKVRAKIFCSLSSIFRFLPPFVARLNFYEAIFFTSEHEFSWRERDVCKFSIASLNGRYMAESWCFNSFQGSIVLRFVHFTCNISLFNGTLFVAFVNYKLTSLDYLQLCYRLRTFISNLIFILIEISMEINKPMIGKSIFCFKKYISIHFDIFF